MTNKNLVELLSNHPDDIEIVIGGLSCIKIIGFSITMNSNLNPCINLLTIPDKIKTLEKEKTQLLQENEKLKQEIDRLNKRIANIYGSR